jgi:hypothetical protein
MATMNPTAVQKAENALTNQRTLTRIINNHYKIQDLDDDNNVDTMIRVGLAILKNAQFKELADWFVVEGGPEELEVAVTLGYLITASRMA